MSTSTPRSSATPGRLVSVAIVSIVIGLGLVVLSIGFDWEGFGGGVVIGVGIGLAAVGMYFWGYANGLRRPSSRGTWLPSRDGRG
ncbi:MULTISPECIES: hypothetical protein [Microbacterium]|uniref:hypothetical protein n=1 Tax=Microbacterium TaxID=33882 RepID=UPI00285F5580|nr:hypothetical protein [Microbacterium trichothecenolyticum]MDR7186628.1 high-affinity Fe2+/Pb2+ permease [Microbacterium trichothecenolyticum]